MSLRWTGNMSFRWNGHMLLRWTGYISFRWTGHMSRPGTKFCAGRSSGASGFQSPSSYSPCPGGEVHVIFRDKDEDMSEKQPFLAAHSGNS